MQERPLFPPISNLKRLMMLWLLAASLSLAQVPRSNHVYVLVEENHSYQQVIGNPNAPYLNSLARSYALAANYDANSHYSIPNYFWLTAGAYVTLSDGSNGTFNVDNVLRYLLPAGKTWKAYEEAIPYAGYLGPSTGEYYRNHDPFAFFSDVANSSTLKYSIVPFTQLATDIGNNALPNYAMIVPDGSDDGHNANMTTVDQWLKANIAPLLASPPFQSGGDGVLFITFDESVDSDCLPLTSCPPLPENGGGGHVATIVVGPQIKHGYASTAFYQHPSVLRTMLAALGIGAAPGSAASAPLMADFFTSSGGTLNVAIAAPAGNTTVASPVQVSASFNGTASYMKLWVDGVQAYKVLNSSSLSTTVSLAAGKHKLTVQAYNGTLYSSSEYITVQ